MTVAKENRLAFEVYAENEGIERAQESFDEAYCGEWGSREEYAVDLFEQLYIHEVPEHLQNYIDYKAFAHDIFICDYYSLSTPSGGIFVFRNL